MTDSAWAMKNTDRELYREPAEHESMAYYEPSVHVTEDGKIGMNVAGTVITLPIREWHALASSSMRSMSVTLGVETPEPAHRHDWFTPPASPEIHVCDGCGDWHKAVDGACPIDGISGAVISGGHAQKR